MSRIRSEKYPTAAITYDQTLKAWFTHDGQTYPVASAPTSIFKDAVLELAPTWRTGPIYGTVLATGKDIDLVARWFLLCSLCEAGRPMRLYASREEAERALGQSIVQVGRS